MIYTTEPSALRICHVCNLWASVVRVVTPEPCKRSAETATLGADLVSFGAFASTATKSNAQVAKPQQLRYALARCVAQRGIKSVVIGGITPERLQQVGRLRADYWAVSAALSDFCRLLSV